MFMVLAKPSTSLVGELRRLTPKLRDMIGDQRRVLIGLTARGGPRSCSMIFPGRWF